MTGAPAAAGATLARFGIAHPVSITPVAGGLIHHSWKVVPRRAGPGTGNLLLQRLNPAVFPDGQLVCRNVARVTAHLARSAVRLGLPDPGRRTLRLLPAPDGEPCLQGPDGAWWRLFHFIEGATSLARTEDPAVARAAGAGFGAFHRLLADFPPPPLAEPLPGFHDTARRLERLEAVATGDRARRTGAVRAELAFARARAAHAEVLPPLLASGVLPPRLAHNDAKLGNLLLDAATGEPLAVVDLDTVMPGTLLYDIGDLIRSLAGSCEEDAPDPSRLRVRPGMVGALAEGFLAGSGGGLAEAEEALFVFAGILLAYEQGVRFLTDYLEGDRYYRITRPEQNLDRCRVQFRLVELLEADRAALERLIPG